MTAQQVRASVPSARKRRRCAAQRLQRVLHGSGLHGGRPRHTNAGLRCCRAALPLVDVLPLAGVLPCRRRRLWGAAGGRGAGWVAAGGPDRAVWHPAPGAVGRRSQAWRGRPAGDHGWPGDQASAAAGGARFAVAGALASALPCLPPGAAGCPVRSSPPSRLASLACLALQTRSSHSLLGSALCLLRLVVLHDDHLLKTLVSTPGGCCLRSLVNRCTCTQAGSLPAMPGNVRSRKKAAGGGATHWRPRLAACLCRFTWLPGCLPAVQPRWASCSVRACSAWANPTTCGRAPSPVPGYRCWRCS